MAKTAATTRLCASCSGITDVSFPVCAPCRPKLMAEVQDARDLIAELDTDLSRQSRKTITAGRKSAETPVFFNPAASIAIDGLREAIHDLARHVTPEGIAMFREARAAALSTIDIPTSPAFIGACHCTGEHTPTPVYGEHGDTVGVCPACDTQMIRGHDDDTLAWSYLEKVVGPLEQIRQHMMVLGFSRSRRQLDRDITKAAVEPVSTINGLRQFRLTEVLWAAAQNGAQQRAA